MSKFLFLLEYSEYINSVVKFEESKYTDEYIYKSFIKNTKGGNLVLKEGLILSQPPDTTIEILKRKFKELIIKKYDDGDISIMGMNDNLGKYLPLINNLGYFISSAFVGNDNIEFQDAEQLDLQCDNVFIEPKFDYMVDIPKILYHCTPLKFKEKIQKIGLSPKSGNKLSNHPNRIYLTNSLDSCVKFGEYLLNSDSNQHYKSGYCIFIVQGEGIDKLYSDINWRLGGFYTLNNIDKKYISLFKERQK